jgi:predicted metal-dependent phosphoesterase TrpH
MKYMIDLHVHSKYSGDNDADPEEYIMQALKIALYGIAFTEHYYFEASEPIEKLKEKYGNIIRIFRGVEFSSSDGHCLVFGVNTDRLSLKNAPVDELVRVVDYNGGVVIPSHPYRGGSSLGDKIQSVKGIYAIEGYNGCNGHAFNAKAIKMANKLNLPYTGGSDAHGYDELGSCYTEFYEDVTEDTLVDVLKKGHYTGIDTRKVSRGWII